MAFWIERKVWHLYGREKKEQKDRVGIQAYAEETGSE